MKRVRAPVFDWLVDEIERIKTPKFHLVEGPASDELRQALEESPVAVPPSYKEFVLRFGNAKLYRQGSLYLVQVFAAPREAESDHGEPLLHFGRTDLSLAYFKKSLLVPGAESPVFEWRHQRGLRKSVGSFEQWLRSKCAAARRLFGKREWEDIGKGPAPFSEKEKEIVDARGEFRWQVGGVAQNGDIIFRVHNGSAIVLPFLTVGIRGQLKAPKTGQLNGAVYLPVSHILPGETKIVEVDCYKEYIDPSTTEVFAEPDPAAEDRDQYWEFKDL